MSDPNFKVQYHKRCVSSYTSKRHLSRLQTFKERSRSHTLTVKRLSEFDFRKLCIFGDVCITEKGKKNAGRWRRVILCR